MPLASYRLAQLPMTPRLRYSGLIQVPDNMPTFTRRTFLGAAATLAVTYSAFAQNSRSGLVSYQTFNKHQLQLRPFVGRNVVLLLAAARHPTQTAIDRVLSAADRGWDLLLDRSAPFRRFHRRSFFLMKCAIFI